MYQPRKRHSWPGAMFQTRGSSGSRLHAQDVDPVDVDRRRRRSSRSCSGPRSDTFRPVPGSRKYSARPVSGFDHLDETARRVVDQDLHRERALRVVECRDLRTSSGTASGGDLASGVRRLARLGDPRGRLGVLTPLSPPPEAPSGSTIGE